jgi:hypothetical protein
MVESLRVSGFYDSKYQSLQPTLFERIEVMMHFGSRYLNVRLDCAGCVALRFDLQTMLKASD